MDAECERIIKRSFETAKGAMMLRFQQGTGFYEEFPWSLPKLMTFILVGEGDREAAIKESRASAAELIRLYRAGSLQQGIFADKFFAAGLPLAAELAEWAFGSHCMQDGLFHELLSYAFSLVAMQRLESRHHLVNMRVSPARASSAAYVSANLRRTLNNDVKEESFRQKFEHYLQHFEELVPETWQSKCELHKLISGHSLALMFQDVSADCALVQAYSLPPRPRRNDLILKMHEHVRVALAPGSCYAVPVSQTDTGATVYMIVKLVDKRPDAKKYMQRSLQWNTKADPWHDCVGVIALGTTTVEPESECVPCQDGKVDLLPLPADTEADVEMGSVEAVQVETFFKYNFDHVYKFQEAVHTCKLSEDAICGRMEDEDDTTDIGGLDNVTMMQPRSI